MVKALSWTKLPKLVKNSLNILKILIQIFFWPNKEIIYAKRQRIGNEMTIQKGKTPLTQMAWETFH